MQLIDAPVIGVNNEVDEEVEEEEEEEDPEEDPNWEENVVPRTPTPPIEPEVGVNPEPIQIVWDFDRVLEIPDSGRVEPELYPMLWRDIYIEGEHPPVLDVALLEPVAPEPMEVENVREERMREPEMVENQADEPDVRGEEEDVSPKEGQGTEEEEESEEQDQEPLVRRAGRRRMSVREYLNQFVRQDDGGSSSRRQPPRSTSDDASDE